MLIKSLKSDWAAAEDASSRVPLYHQLYLSLKRSITSGQISLSEQMPTEQQLSEALDISRITAKRAMDELAAEGLIARQRGKGSYVTYKYSPEPVKAPLLGLLENLEDMGKHSLVKVMSVEKIVPPEEMRELLGLPENQEAIKIVRTRYDEDGNVFAFYVSWTLPHLKGFTKRKVERQTRLSIIKENKISIARVEQTLGAQNADEMVANLLNVVNNAALLELRRNHFDKEGNLIDILIGLYNPKRFQYGMVLDQ
ncbi:MAG: GntR family transcriptional regulator [Acidiferrobacterales bacterium]|nr:GntR family transcriptional regulator [Acidiferrobacterales bacterium]